MDEQFLRTRMILGADAVERLRCSHVIVFGLGGVGSYAARTYAAYENGVNSMTPETLIKIAKLHNVSVDYLLELTDNPNPYPKNNQKL